MRRVIALLGGVLLALAVTFAATPLIVSSDMVREGVAGRIVALTGYDIVIRGETEIALFPSLRFVMHDVGLSVPGAGEEAEVATIESLKGAISMLPLLTGRIEVNRFTLVRPLFSVEIAADGGDNWDSGARGIIGVAVRHPESLPSGHVRIGDMRIEGGRVSYRDARDGSFHAFDGIQATLSWPSLAEPVSGTGELRHDGEQVAFTFSAEAPLSLLTRNVSSARLTVSSPAGGLSFVGTAGFDDEAALDGRLVMSAASTRDLLARLGTEFGTGAGLDEIELAGQFSLRGRDVDLTDLRMSLDGNRAEGRLGLNMGRTGRLRVDGTLAFGTLDLDTYLGGTLLAEAGAALGLADPDPLMAPFDFEDLRKIDMDIRLSASDVSVAQLSLGRAAGTVTVREGVLTVGIGEAELYGGVGQGTLTLSAAEDSARSRIAVTLDNVAAGPLLALVTDPPPLGGTGGVSLNLNATGDTVAEMLDRLSGEARIVIRDGAIEGLDAARLIQGLHGGPAEGQAEGRTAFDRLAGRFAVTDGVARTEDFRLSGAGLEIGLVGDLQLMTGALSARGAAELVDAEPPMSVPFLIEGHLLRPVIYPDPAWALAPGDNRLDRLREQLEHLAPEGVIEGVLRRGARRLPGLPAD